MTLTARDRLVFPLDFGTLEEAQRHIDQLAEDVGVFKVGLELFVAAGPDAVRAVHERGATCFLDLKLHDIPATVERAVKSAVRLGARYLTVHAANGPACLAAAAKAAEGSKTELLAVTVLTSHDEASLAAIGVGGGTREAVVKLGRLAVEAGVRGLVCSPHEVVELRKALGAGIKLVVPGVRPRGAEAGDQRRVATPREAIAAGADLIVVGRPIRDANDPVAAARSIVTEISSAS